MDFSRLTIIVLCCFCLIACDRSQPPTEGIQVSNTPQQFDTNVVEVSRIETKPLEYLINTNGKVKSQKTVELSSKIAGLVKKVYIENGDYVSKGQPIASLEDEVQKIALERAKISLDEAKLQFQNELIGYQGNDSLSSVEGVVIDNLRLSSGLKKAELNYQEAKLEFENTLLMAPFSGQISDLDLSEGQNITSGDQVALLHDITPLQIEAHILELDYPALYEGLACTSYPVGNESLAIEGILENINPAVDPETGLVKIMITVTSHSKALIPGMNLKTVIKVPRQPQLVVPKEAVVIRSGKEVVFTVEDNVAKWNYVKTGFENGEEIEVLEGIDVNADIVVSNNLQLSHDAPVKIRTRN